MLPRRLSTRPHKQLLWLWLDRDMRSMGGEIGLDAACGLMENKRFFRTRRYIGIDMDETRLKSALARHPDASGEVLKIEDLSERHRADVVLCVQTIGTNRRSNWENSRQVVRKLTEMTKDGGSMILTLGKQSEVAPCIADLRAAFNHVEVRHLGGSKEMPIIMSIPVAYAMMAAPRLRRGQKTYVCCLGKRRNIERPPL